MINRHSRDELRGYADGAIPSTAQDDRRQSAQPLDLDGRAVVEICICHPADCGRLVRSPDIADLRARACRLLVDTGALRSTITLELARNLDLPVLNMSADGRKATVEASLIIPRIGGPPDRTVLVQTRWPLDVVAGCRGAFTGQLGADLLRGNRLEFDADGTFRFY